MWESIRQSAEIDWLRQDAERRLLQLDALDDIDALQAARRSARRSGAGAPPTDWAALDPARACFRGIPVDPDGHAVRTRRRSGRVSLVDRRRRSFRCRPSPSA